MTHSDLEKIYRTVQKDIILKNGPGAGVTAHLVECLPNMQKASASNNPAVVANTCNISTWEVEQVYQQFRVISDYVHSGLRTSLGYMNPCFKKKVGVKETKRSPKERRQGTWYC